MGMENFNAQGYRDQLAKDIKSESDHEKRQEILEGEKNTVRYDVAENKSFAKREYAMNQNKEKKEAIKQKELKELEIIGCTTEEIAYGLDKVNEKKKVYVGEWNLEIFKKMPKNIEHIYTSFPEVKIVKENIKLSNSTSEEYLDKLKKDGIKVSAFAEEAILPKMPQINDGRVVSLIQFSISQLGFSGDASLSEIYKKAVESGLILCPPQVGPEICLKYNNSPICEHFNYLNIAMDPVPDGDGNLNNTNNGMTLFHINSRENNKLELNDMYSGSGMDYPWHNGSANDSSKFVFCVSESKKADNENVEK
ncbi:MAG: hypothetical protein WCK37_04570 [Candidatus Falkowbacteria bacterium]